MQTEKISGYFDVRKYDKKVDRKDRKILGENDNITFNTSFSLADLPHMFKTGNAPDEFVKLYSSRDEVRNAEAERRDAVYDRASIKFKIGANAHWFDKFGKATTKPSNEELDGEHFDVQIDFKRRAKNPDDDKAPSGYWVNAIMIRKKDANPFAGQAFEEEDDAEPETAEPAYIQHFDNDEADVKLPFDE